MIKRISAIGLMVLTICACEAKLDYDAIEVTVADRLEAFRLAVESGDTEVITDFYSQSEDFWWVEDGRLAYPDYKTMKASLEGLVNLVSKTEMNLKSIGVNPMDKDKAMVYMDYEQKLYLKQGGSFEINGATTVIMVKEGETWRFLNGHSSTLKAR